MKRSLEFLSDSRGLEEEELLRHELAQAHQQEQVARDKKNAEASRVAALNSTIAQWDAMGLRHAAGCEVFPPMSLPRIGPFSLLLSRVCDPPGDILFVSGASLKLSRRSTALSIYSHFLPNRLWKDLAESTSSFIIEQLSKGKIGAGPSRHHSSNRLYEYVMATCIQAGSSFAVGVLFKR